jgi:FdhD protein
MRRNGAPLGPKSMALRRLLKVAEGAAREVTDALAVEEPLEIRVDGEPVAVTMRTPGQDAELALGFLFAEGIIASAHDVGSVAHCGRPGEESYGNVVDVRSAGGAPIDVERVLESRRWSLTSSACGVCGRRSIQALLERCGPVAVKTRLATSTLLLCIERLAAAQPIFARTGGLHAAGIFTASGDLLASAEDVGRHNAVDKAVGALLRESLIGDALAATPSRPRGLPSSEARTKGVQAAASARRGPAVLAVSGRASFEIVQKATAAGVPFVASVSAPSTLAVDLAQRAGIALLGFVRAGRHNVYSNGWRLGDEVGAKRPASPSA